MNERKVSVARTTDHAEVTVVLNFDGKGSGTVQTGFPFLDQMLILFARSGAFDIEIQCRSKESDPRLWLEDIATCLGLALDKALGDKKGIVRSGHSYTPVDEHLARAVVEISGHGCLVYRVRASNSARAVVDSDAVERFWRCFAAEARLNLHIELLYGGEGLPAFEAIFKAAGRALRDAGRIAAPLKPY
jgi:imidazoleglycerol-phosphate dehydratase